MKPICNLNHDFHFSDVPAMRNQSTSFSQEDGTIFGAKFEVSAEAGMYALREWRQHVMQEDFEFAVAKV